MADERTRGGRTLSPGVDEILHVEATLNHRNNIRKSSKYQNERWIYWCKSHLYLIIYFHDPQYHTIFACANVVCCQVPVSPTQRLQIKCPAEKQQASKYHPPAPIRNDLLPQKITCMTPVHRNKHDPLSATWDVAVSLALSSHNHPAGSVAGG